jgi:MFS family permease
MRTLKTRATFPFLLYFFSQFIRLTAIFTLSPVLPIYVRDLGFSIADLGTLAASFGVALMIFEPLWGLLADKVGAKRILLLSTAAMALITLSYTFVRDFSGFVLLRFLSGVFGSACGVSSRTLALQVVSKEERAFGVWYTFYAGATVVGPLVGGLLAVTSYDLAFYTSTAISLVALFISFGLPESKNSDPSGKDFHIDKISARMKMSGGEKRTLLIISAMIIIPFFVKNVYTTFMPVYAKESPKLLLSPLEIGLAFTAIGVVGFLVPLLFSELSNKAGVPKIITSGMLLYATSLFLLPTLTGLPMLCLTSIILGLGEAAVTPLMMALITSKTSASNRGLAIGLYGAGEDIGILLGPLVAAYIYQIYGAEYSFYLTAIIMLVSAVIYMPLLRKVVQ